MPATNTFEVEYAKSNMATCRVCMAKIPKESLRIGHLQTQLDNDMPPAAESDVEGADADKRLKAVASAVRWHHFECFPRMKGAKWMSQHLPSKADELKGFSALKKPDQKKLQNLWKAISGESATSGSKKRKAEEPAEASGGKKAKKGEAKAKAAGKRGEAKVSDLTEIKGVLKDKEYKQVRKCEQDLSGKTQAQLQAELAKNNQVRNGKREELLRRVAEGRALGALPSCPKCEKGQIHWSRIGGWYSCPGYFDREAKVQKRCNFRTKELERKPWEKL